MKQSVNFENTEIKKFHLYKLKGKGEILNNKLTTIDVNGKKIIVKSINNEIYLFPLDNPLIMIAVISGLVATGIIGSTFLFDEIEDTTNSLTILAIVVTAGLLLIKWKKII